MHTLSPYRRVADRSSLSPSATKVAPAPKRSPWKLRERLEKHLVSPCLLAFSSLRSLELQVPAGGEHSVGELLSSCQQGLQAPGSESGGCLPVWRSILRFAGAFFRNWDLASLQLPSTTPSNLPSCFSLALLVVSLLLLGPRHLVNKLPRAQLGQRLWLRCCKFLGSVLRKRLQNRRLRSSLFVYGWFWGTQKQPSSL